MARAFRDFSGPILLLLSENDYTAKEFLEYITTADGWRGLLARPNIERVDVQGANHTFSSEAWRAHVEETCAAWIARLTSSGTGNTRA